MKTIDPSYDTEPTYGMRNALRLVLMFYAVGEWTQERRDEWRRLAGTYEATTKVLCNHVRGALAVGAWGDAAEGERLWGLSPGHVLTERDVEDIKNMISEHNDEIGTSADAVHLGRMQAFAEIGGQELVDKMMARDEAIVNEAVKRAMDRWHDMNASR